MGRESVRPIRVLVVDDAVVIRRLVSDALAADPELEVVGHGGERAHRAREARAGRSPTS